MGEARDARARSADPRGTGLAEPMWKYVEVEAAILPSGFVAPKALIWDDGRRFEIDRVTLSRYDTFKQTWHYEVLIHGKTKDLWFRRGAFFVLVKEGGNTHCTKPPEMNAYELRKKYGYRA